MDSSRTRVQIPPPPPIMIVKARYLAGFAVSAQEFGSMLDQC